VENDLGPHQNDYDMDADATPTQEKQNEARA